MKRRLSLRKTETQENPGNDQQQSADVEQPSTLIQKNTQQSNTDVQQPSTSFDQASTSFNQASASLPKISELFSAGEAEDEEEVEESLLTECKTEMEQLIRNYPIQGSPLTFKNKPSDSDENEDSNRGSVVDDQHTVNFNYYPSPESFEAVTSTMKEISKNLYNLRKGIKFFRGIIKELKLMNNSEHLYEVERPSQSPKKMRRNST